MNPNVTIKPNVFIKSSTELVQDSNFLRQVRGRKALLAILRRICPSSSLLSTARTYLSQRQLAELAWDVACAECGAFPEGAVKKDGKEEVQFRCPKKRCPSRQLVGRTVLLDPELVDRLIRAFGESLTELAAVALAEFQKSRSDEPAMQGLRRPYTIALTSSQNYFFSDVDIESALRQLAEEKH
jgi:hypothetical protein